MLLCALEARRHCVITRAVLVIARKIEYRETDEKLEARRAGECCTVPLPYVEPGLQTAPRTDPRRLKQSEHGASVTKKMKYKRLLLREMKFEGCDLDLLQSLMGSSVACAAHIHQLPLQSTE